MVAKLYPVGIQTFEKVIGGNYLYVDKTEYIYRAAPTKGLGASLDPNIRLTYLIKMMRKFNVRPMHVGKMEALASAFDAPTENMTAITPLLYQNGDVTVARMSVLIRQDNMDGALQLLQDFLGTVPYCNVINYEDHYQQMLFIIFSLLTDYLVDVEVHTPNGRMDIVMETATQLIIELKLNKNAQTTLQQINLKNYAQCFALCGKPITKVGINFDSTKGNIEGWKIEA